MSIRITHHQNFYFLIIGELQYFLPKSNKTLFFVRSNVINIVFFVRTPLYLFKFNKLAPKAFFMVIDSPNLKILAIKVQSKSLFVFLTILITWYTREHLLKIMKVISHPICSVTLMSTSFNLSEHNRPWLITLDFRGQCTLRGWEITFNFSQQTLTCASHDQNCQKKQTSFFIRP